MAVDHDAELLAHPGHDGSRRVRGSVQDLPEVLAALPGGTGASWGRDVRTRGEGADGQHGAGPQRGTVVPTVVVATAVLDVLTTQDLTALADAVAIAGAGLLSLSVTGEVRWEPADPADVLLSAAFDDHQRRDGRPGPDAPAVLTRLLRERGLQVLTASTPWDLPGRDGRYRALLERWLDERVEDAVERDPSSAVDLRTWQQRRREQLASGGLRVLVDHVDLLALDAGGLGGPGGRGVVPDGPHGAQPGA
ncbi:hypothetical protein [Ornithinimicrobium sp. W1665]|uniref:hypothetical protein n=1 Tax=Ornithinimicrobium sp. W1665 TaxID=3416666 RepID=UPI003D6B5E76